MIAAILVTAALAGEAPAAPRPAEPPPAAAVVAAVAKAARENAALPAEKRLSGDALGDHYVRRAAAAAGKDPRALLVGLAHALDPEATLARHPLTAAAFRGLETEEEAAARRKALGAPSLRGRRDHLLHFACSAALAALAGEPAALAAGIAKEEADSRGGSGFSFADLAADLAGIRFAAWLLAEDGKGRLERVAAGFAGGDFAPDPAGEPEGLDAKAFAERFGSVSDERFLAKVRAIREKVAALPAGRGAEAPLSPR